jgi:predicted RNA-binding Zn-ribbon protein involved in translation (DUF1610 family)
MEEMQSCPSCGFDAEIDVSRGDLHACPSCGRMYWTSAQGGRGYPFETRAPRRGLLWAAWVLAVSIAVLTAELVLAAAIYGGAAFAAARMAGIM